LSRLIELIEASLPIAAWRREKRSVRPKGNAQPETRGVELPERSWEGNRARYYNNVSGGQRYELGLSCDEEGTAPSHEQWVRAMVARCEQSSAEDEVHYDVVEDHIERVRAQELRQQALTRFFEAILAQLRDGVVIADACGCLLFVNAQASEWLGLPSREMDDTSLLQLDRELLLPEDTGGWASIISEALSTGRSQLECRSRRGLDLYLDMLRIRAGRQPGEVLILTLKDISEVK